MIIDKKRISDPMVILLAALLLFMCCGTVFAGCSKKEEKIRIELDAAFGGDATGYAGIVNEADVTEQITDRLYRLMGQDERFEVLRTHEPGTSASVSAKAEKINADEPSLLVSIHTGGVPNASVSGMTIYPAIPSSRTNGESVKAAETIADAFTSETWTPALKYLYYKPFTEDSYQIQLVDISDTQDYKLETWAILQKVNVPAVVVEQFYVTNQKDVDTWANEASYDNIAMQYYKALCTYYAIEPKDITVPAKEESGK
jgi:N-acetylmuramoyl-L-alanine amidase